MPTSFAHNAGIVCSQCRHRLLRDVINSSSWAILRDQRRLRQSKRRRSPRGQAGTGSGVRRAFLIPHSGPKRTPLSPLEVGASPGRACPQSRVSVRVLSLESESSHSRLGLRESESPISEPRAGLQAEGGPDRAPLPERRRRGTWPRHRLPRWGDEWIRPRLCLQLRAGDQVHTEDGSAVRKRRCPARQTPRCHRKIPRCCRLGGNHGLQESC